jgi:hypothetical protein
MRGELPTRVARSDAPPSSVGTAWSRFAITLLNPELQTLIALCIIGILATLDVALRFPDFGALIADLNSFP